MLPGNPFLFVSFLFQGKMVWLARFYESGESRVCSFAALSTSGERKSRILQLFRQFLCEHKSLPVVSCGACGTIPSTTAAGNTPHAAKPQ
jgi:hypothetical protein